MKKCLLSFCFLISCLCFSQQTEDLRLIKEKYEVQLQNLENHYKIQLLEKNTKRQIKKINIQKSEDIRNLEFNRECEYLKAIKLSESDISNMKSVKSQGGETKPVHPKGDAFFKEELSKNMNIQAIQGKGQITCKLIFVVEKDGSIVKAIGIGDHEKFNRYAELAILLTQDKWEPAKKDGLPVRALMSVPLTLNFE